LGPDGFPESETLAAQQLTSQGQASVTQNAAISFDPRQFDRESVSSNTLSQKRHTGGEDWLTVSFHVNFPSFDELAKQLDDAQVSALKGVEGPDEVQFGELRFLVADRGARQGTGAKSIYMRWRLVCENGLVVLVMNRDKAHTTMPNVSVRATSLLLMHQGFRRVWDLMQYAVEALGGEIVGNKLSRVDACVDLPGVPVAEFVEPYGKNWIVTRSRSRTNYALALVVHDYVNGKQSTGFVVGKPPLNCRVYDKLDECKLDVQKLAILEATRWDGRPEHATRVEFRIDRPKLKQFGVSTVDDWIAKRADVLDRPTMDWFRLTAGPVNRKHAERSPVHPIWERTREQFFAWCGEATGQELTPLPTLEISTSRQIATVIGIFSGMFARVGKDIEDNRQFFREVEFAVKQGVGIRDMAAEVARKALKLGTVGIKSDWSD
jgi:hypothetical protein